MQRSALLVSAGIVAALVFACTPPPPVAPPAPPPLAMAGAGLTCNGGNPTTFLNKVNFFADANFQPGRGIQQPTPLSSPPPNAATYLQGLQNAFCAAPPDFQTALSSLDAVWINTAPCASGNQCFTESWGWWRRLLGPPPFSYQRIVGLSASLWSTTYSGYETQLTQTILQQSGITYSQVQPVDDLPTALLAALAHEVGHIRWFEWGVNSNPLNYCAVGNWNFFGGWSPSTVFQPPGNSTNGYWRDLLTPNGRAHVRNPVTRKYPYKHSSPPQMDDIDAQPDGSPVQEQLIYQLLVPPPPIPAWWASLFAAMSPDEDFIETYKFKVLTDGSGGSPLTSATITVPRGTSGGSGGTANIIVDYHNGARADLTAKVGCITSY